MKIQKMTDGKVVTREISVNDLGYFQHKGWEAVCEQDDNSVVDNDFSMNRKKKHRFEDEA
ncbi:MAG: hypothetical protein L6V86_08920 [Treponema sp.]|nr:MAG: hypothetical protein L6V86_08920 [Treponema sp.]DAF75580.1 MAG TPA: hypothetical protein [Caudoviricetes sp.]